MTLVNILVFLHILAAAIWLGGALVGMLIGNQLRASGEVDAFARFCAAFAKIAGPVFGGSALVVGITGTWLVAREGAPGFGDLWISLGFTGWLIAFVMGATVVGMSWTKLGKELADGATLESVDSLVRRAVRVTWLDLAIRTAVIVVMVWRPT